MKICFVNDGELNEFWDNHKAVECNVLCFSFNGIGNVSYKEELDGATSKFEDLTILSRELKNVVICGCYTENLGFSHKSVAVAESGRLLGVADQTHILDKDYTAGAGLKIFDTSVGKIGIIVAEDLYFFENFRSLSNCEADIIFVIFEEIQDFVPQILVRSNAFCNGVIICLCANGYSAIANKKGEILTSSANKCVCVDLELEKEYHLIEYRHKGFCKENKKTF